MGVTTLLCAAALGALRGAGDESHEPYLFGYAVPLDWVDVLDTLSYELHALTLQPMDAISVPDTLIEAFLRLNNALGRMKSDTFGDSRKANDVMQYHLLEYLHKVWAQPASRLRVVLPGGRDGWKEAISKESQKSLSYVRAWLSMLQARVPLCHRNDVCVVDKAYMSFWRFANSDAQLLEDGLGRDFFHYIRQYLPASARWTSPWQCPPNFDARLEARPIWPHSALPEGSAARRLVDALRANAAEIAADLRSGILSPEGQAMIRDPAWPGLHQGGGWMAFTLYRTAGFFGRKEVPRELDPLHCRIAHRTCRILQEAKAPPGMLQKLPALQASQEVVDFLRADPGTTVNFHAASINARLTIQICLAGCEEDDSNRTNGGSYIQVGQEKAHYRFGEPIVFDDSFLHSVVVETEGSEPRWVISVQLMKTSLESAESFEEHYVGQEAK
eukprot:TRINITY_DN51495_c0_g1_i1.p1 TRINITY_DN51495_c0_g1~~TRINITY_DN51495_c0_g1_i1.p1  ORF type:complete len:444 (-),score=66.65 TRINITY_DN51495_c0_g1_i1:12-1343(-)